MPAASTHSVSRHSRRWLTVTAVALFGIGIALVAPGSAAFADEVTGVTVVSTTAPYTITVDCLALEEGSTKGYLALRADEAVTVTTVNCLDYKLGARYSDVEGFTPGIIPTDGGFIPADDGKKSPSPAQFTVNTNTEVALYRTTREGSVLSSTSDRFRLRVIPAPLLTNPSGTLGITKDVTLGRDGVLEFNATGAAVPDDDSEIFLGDNELCKMESGPHAYATISVDILIAGEYSFRLINTNTLTTDLQFWQDSNTMADPFLALYRNFDPIVPSDNVVGCSDDLSDIPGAPIGGDSYAYTTESGQLIGGRYPQFVAADLQPGTYTLVYTAFGTLSAAEWIAEDAQSIGTFEIWGPEGGFVPLDPGKPLTPAEPLLPATGMNAALWTGIGALFMLTGGALLITRRWVA
jgi:hypothetical protein